MRDLINKKFKTEKATKKRMDEKYDEKLYFDELLFLRIFFRVG